MASCIVSEFKKKVGDTVKKGDILFGYETDKATFEEESQVEGTVLAIFYKDGDEIPVLQNVMVIGQPGESFEEFAPSAANGDAGKGAAGGTEPSETHATLGTVRGGTKWLKTTLIVILILVALAAVALATFVILAQAAPDFIDSILYTPEELRIINYQ